MCFIRSETLYQKLTEQLEYSFSLNLVLKYYKLPWLIVAVSCPCHSIVIRRWSGGQISFEIQEFVRNKRGKDERKLFLVYPPRVLFHLHFQLAPTCLSCLEFELCLLESFSLVVKNHPFISFFFFFPQLMREENAILQFWGIYQISGLHFLHQRSLYLLCKLSGAKWKLFIVKLFKESLNIAENEGSLAMCQEFSWWHDVSLIEKKQNLTAAWQKIWQAERSSPNYSGQL